MLILLLLAVLFFAFMIPMATGNRSIPAGMTCGDQFSSPETALVIPNPKISWANYHVFDDCEHPIHWYEVTGNVIRMTISIPAVPRFKDVRISGVVVGPNLPPPPAFTLIPQSILQYVTDNDLGMITFASPKDQTTCDHVQSTQMKGATSVLNGRCHFHEKYSGSNMWVIYDDTVLEVPPSTFGSNSTVTYKIALYETNFHTTKMAVACCDFNEDFQTSYPNMTKSQCGICGSLGTNNPSWISYYFEQQYKEEDTTNDMLVPYGNEYPPYTSCAATATDNVETSMTLLQAALPQGEEQCPPDPNLVIKDSTEKDPTCVMDCKVGGVCHSYNMLDGGNVLMVMVVVVRTILIG